MPEIKNNFLNGKMEKDIDVKLVSNGSYREAQNITISESDTDKVGTGQPILGNKLNYTTPLTLGTGVEVIGYCLDQRNDRVFWFVTNFEAEDTGDVRTMSRASGNVCKIIYQDLSSTSVPKTIVSGDFLNFNKKKLITGVNIIDDLLFWNDDYNQPRKINVDKAINNPAYYNSEDKISLAKVAPYLTPSLVEHTNLSTVTTTRTQPSNNPSIESDYLKENFVRFSYRYIYGDNEQSLMAPFTQVVFRPLNSATISNSSSDEHGQINIRRKGVVNIMQNDLNDITLRIPLPYITDQLKDDIIWTTGVSAISATSPGDTFVVDFGAGALSTPNETYIVKGIDSTIETAGVTHVTIPALGPSNQTVTLQQGQITSTGSEDIAFVPIWRNYLGIKKIQVLIKESDDQAVRIVSEINVSGEDESQRIGSFEKNIDVYPVKNSSSGDVYWRYCYAYNYKSEKPYKALPEAEITRVNDIIPVRARSQEMVSNRLILGNITQDYDLPLDESGNVGINYIVTASHKGDIENSAGTEIDNGPLQHLERAYKYHSIKQRRTYQVGIVLADKYGRESSVILSTNPNLDEYLNQTDTITIPADVSNYFRDPDTSLPTVSGDEYYSWSLDQQDVIGKSMQIDFKDSRIVPQSEVYSATNPHGWYSWKLVVKQQEQEYYNVYVDHAVDRTNLYADAIANKSYILLTGDNINKVPREINDQDINRNGVSGSTTRLFPKVVHSTGGDSIIAQYNSDEEWVDVEAIGTARELGLYNDAASTTSTNPTYSGFYTNKVFGWVRDGQNDPLLAEVRNLDYFYTNNNDITATINDGLSVFETEPFESKLDIYYETSTSGLVSDLNESLLAALGDVPSNIEWATNAGTSRDIYESAASGAVLGTVEADVNGSATSIEEYEVISFEDGFGNDLSNKVEINSSGVFSIKSSSDGFNFRNSPADANKLIVRVTDDLGLYSYGELTLNVLNSSPNITIDTDAEISRSTTVGYVVAKAGGDLYTGTFNNGANNDKKYDNVSFTITFPNISDSTIRSQCETMFTVEKLSEGKLNVKTTSQFQTYVSIFENLTVLERTITVTVTDLNGAGLSSSDTMEIYISEPRVQFITTASTIGEVCQDVATGAGIETIWIASGSGPLDTTGNIINLGNILYTSEYGVQVVPDGVYTFLSNAKIAVVSGGAGVVTSTTDLIC